MKRVILALLLVVASASAQVSNPIYNGILQNNLNANKFGFTNINDTTGLAGTNWSHNFSNVSSPGTVFVWPNTAGTVAVTPSTTTTGGLLQFTGTTGGAVSDNPNFTMSANKSILEFDGNFGTALQVKNNTSGTAANSSVIISSVTNHSLALRDFSDGSTTQPPIVLAGDAVMTGDTGVNILSGGSQPIRFSTDAGVTEKARIKSGLMVGTTTDPGVGVINVLTGYQIGNAAANQHFLLGNGTNFVDAGSSLTMDTTNLIETITGNVNAVADYIIQNTSTGTAGQAAFVSKNSVSQSNYGTTSTGLTAAGLIVADMGYLYTTGGAGLGFFSNNATGPITFVPGGTTTAAAKMYPSLGTYFGSTPADPGANVVEFQGVTRYAGLTFATLPTAAAGMQAYITDGLAANCGDATCTTWGTTVTGGGGALKLLIWRNGANWTLVGK